MQLHPREQFIISRQLADTTDTDTNYVRAVVRNAKTDELLKTVSLTDKGSRRFTGVYEVPEDPSGEGFYITITTTVMTSAAFTTANTNYGEEQETYLVQVRKNNLGGGSGGDIDMKSLERMIRKVLKKEAPEEGLVVPELATKSDILVLATALDSLSAAVFSLPKEVKTETINNTPLLEAISGLKTMITAIPTEASSTDLSPVLDLITVIVNQLADVKQTIIDQSIEIMGSVEDSNNTGE